MKITKILPILTLSLTFCSYSYAQIAFEKAYFLTNNQEKTECLIKNKDWRYNPTEFEYRLTENSAVLTLGIEEVSEFGIYGVSKYLRQEIDIDRSEDQKQKLGFSREPKWSKEILFLKVLLEGETSLFSFQDRSILRYFFKVKDSDIQQLINKAYYTENPNSMRWNDGFKQQLWSMANCNSLPMAEFKDLAYTQKTLLKYVKNENSCLGNEVEEVRKKRNVNVLNLKLVGGLRHTSAYGIGLLTTPSSRLSFDQFFEKKLSFRMGLELEYILPFNNNRWAVFGGPNFQYYESVFNYYNRGNFVIDYKSIEFSGGFRHFVFINPSLRLFANLSFVYDYTLPSTRLSFDTPSEYEWELFTSSSFDYGLGIQLGNKLSAEFRYHGRRRMSRYVFYKMKLHSYSLILGYTLF